MTLNDPEALSKARQSQGLRLRQPPIDTHGWAAHIGCRVTPWESHGRGERLGGCVQYCDISAGFPSVSVAWDGCTSWLAITGAG